MFKIWAIGLVASILAFGTHSALGATPQLNSTMEKASVVESLRELVKSLVVELYMLEEYYLENWLEVHDFNVDQTFQSFKQYLEWRVDFNLTEIGNEDLTQLRKIFPLSMDTVDKQGRPVLYWNINDWDILGFLAEGDFSARLFERYVYLQLEEGEARVRQIRLTGKDVRQYTIVLNLGGFSLAKHVSLQSLNLFRTITTRLSPFKSVHVYKTFFINSPSLFKATYYFLSKEAQSFLVMFGQDKPAWESSLLEVISRDQFPKGLLEELPASQVDNAAGLLQWNKEL